MANVFAARAAHLIELDLDAPGLSRGCLWQGHRHNAVVIGHVGFVDVNIDWELDRAFVGSVTPLVVPVPMAFLTGPAFFCP
jgi:hypothetical protein